MRLLYFITPPRVCAALPSLVAVAREVIVVLVVAGADLVHHARGCRREAARQGQSEREVDSAGPGPGGAGAGGGGRRREK